MRTEATTNCTRCVISSASRVLIGEIVLVSAALLFPAMARSQVSEWTVYDTGNSGIPDNRIATVAIDSRGNVWTGHSSAYGIGSGCAQFDGTNWTVYNTSNSGLPNNRIVALVIDPQDNIWTGSGEGSRGGDKGLVKYDGVNWTIYNTGNSGLTANGVWGGLAIDPYGNLWAGPYTETPSVYGGLVGYDGHDSWVTYDTSNSGLPDNWVYSLAIDAQGAIWVGTGEDGLAVFRPRPAVDLNGDETVNIQDIVPLIELWGQDDPLADIVPPPFGDHVVDTRDLEALMSYWGQEIFGKELVAYWKLDETEGETAYSSVTTPQGTRYGGMVYGQPTWQPTGGRIGGALEFDGVDDCVMTEFVCDPSEGPFSVFAWVQGGGPGQTILSQAGGVNWLMVASDGVLLTQLMQPGRVSYPLASADAITDGAWHRVGFTWDGSYRMLYIDDSEVVRDTQTSLTGAVGGLYIGADNALVPDAFWSGLIDDVRIYNRAVIP